jgi:uroporphyrinogen-III synthase
VPNRIKELEQRLERSEQQLRLFQKISRFMVRDMEFVEVLDGIVDLVVLCASSEHRAGTVGKVSLALNEGLTGWVARERRLLAISREAYNDPRFKYFKDLPEDTYEAFLSAPVISRSRVVGVINVQHRSPHAHTGSELEMITTVGEQVGCLLMLARLAASGLDVTHPSDLIFTSK